MFKGWIMHADAEWTMLHATCANNGEIENIRARLRVCNSSIHSYEIDLPPVQFWCRNFCQTMCILALFTFFNQYPGFSSKIKRLSYLNAAHLVACMSVCKEICNCTSVQTYKFTGHLYQLNIFHNCLGCFFFNSDFGYVRSHAHLTPITTLIGSALWECACKGQQWITTTGETMAD